MRHDEHMSTSDDNERGGRPMRLDVGADSTNPDLPVFLARPDDAPAYHGFPLIEGAVVDGFRLGMITDFIAAPDTVGDGFVVAPDGSRAGLVWEAEVPEPYLEQVLAPDDQRWGVWAVGLRESLRTEADAWAYLAALVPILKPRWKEWASQR